MTQNPIVLKELTPPIKVLFTGYLCTVGIGYMFALIQILFTHGMADGKFGLSVDVVCGDCTRVDSAFVVVPDVAVEWTDFGA